MRLIQLVAWSFVVALFGAKPAFAYDFFGPPQPRDESACTDHFANVFSETLHDRTKFERENCVIGMPMKQYQACYERLRQIGEAHFRDMEAGRKACWARVREAADRQAAQDRAQAQAAAEQRSREQAVTQPRYDAKRVTTIPLTPAPTTSPSRQGNAARAAAAFANGLEQLRQQQADKEREDAAEQEAAQAAEKRQAQQQRETEQRQALARESERKRSEDLKQRIAENNDRAIKLFDMARDQFRWNPVVAAVQDYAWEQLDKKIQDIPQQMDILDSSIKGILGKAPAADDVSNPASKFRSRTLIDYIPGVPRLTYQGAVDAKGRPTGRGVISGTVDGSDWTYYGSFKNGEMTGSARVEGKSADTAWVWEGEVDKHGPNGLGRMTTKDRTVSFTKEDVFQGKWSTTEPTVGRLTNDVGDVYVGYALKGKPTGPGKWTYENGSTLTFTAPEDGSVWAKHVYRGGLTKRCKMNLTLDYCDGPTRIEFPNGGFNAGVQKNGEWIGQLSGGGKVEGGPEYIFECDQVLGVCEGMGYFHWASGTRYDGEFHSGRWGKGTIGRFSKANGGVDVGRFDDNKLVDGYSASPTGSTVNVGSGAIYYPGKFARRN